MLLTGLPAAGKSELAYELESLLAGRGKLSVVLDPDDGLGRHVPEDGASPWGAPEFSRRLVEAELLAILAYGTPLRSDRESLREAVGAERFFEIHVKTALEVCKARDLRGAYGEKPQGYRYESPAAPALSLELAVGESPRAAALAILELLETRGRLKGD